VVVVSWGALVAPLSISGLCVALRFLGL
jgi:hypothetical protein